MDKTIFEVEISNSGPKSYETATVMKMPASFAEFSDALQKARIKDGSFCKNELTCIHYNGLTHAMIGWNANLYDLNLFAQRLASLTEEQKKGMDALLKIKQNHRVAPIPLNQLINLTYNTDICCFAPRVSNHEELGAFLYANEMLSNEAMALLDTTEEGSGFRERLLELLGEQHQEDHGGVFTDFGYAELGGEIKDIYVCQSNETACFHRSDAPVVLEVRKGFFNDPSYDNDKTAVLNLPAADAGIWRAVEKVDAASVDECAFRCVDCLIPFLRDAINNAIDDEDGIEQADEFAKRLAQIEREWPESDMVKYKALLSVVDHPSLQDATRLMGEIDQYELRPEVAQTWGYAEMMFREKYSALPEELFQTPQAAQIGQKMLDDRLGVITEYAAYELGKMYRDGIGCEKDAEASEQWYRQAFAGFLELEQQSHDDKLQYRIGWMLLHGVGTGKDETAAREWFEQASKLDNPHAQYQLARMIFNDPSSTPEQTAQALERLTKAAEAGQDCAQYALGKIYRDGQGVEKDIQKAVALFTLAATKENSFAAFALGKLYLAGDAALPRDPAAALKWLTYAAELGNQFAQYRLGKLLLKGDDGIGAAKRHSRAEKAKANPVQTCSVPPETQGKESVRGI